MEKVILVEDDTTMLSLLSTLLEMEGYQVFAGFEDSVEKILAGIASHKPDAVLLDVHLRNVNGLDVLKAVRHDPELTKIKIIMSSGMDFQKECFAAGANGFLIKPYMPDDLIIQIKKVIAEG